MSIETDHKRASDLIARALKIIKYLAIPRNLETVRKAVRLNSKIQIAYDRLPESVKYRPLTHDSKP